ncbi:MAG: DMT family transporter [Ruminococcaceae bacterium]|nr:DMT family transporter [Oscillospiraceae bacterium]
MIDLILAIISSALIAVIMRISSRRVQGRIGMLAANYLTCLFLGAWYAGFRLFPADAPGLAVTAGMGAVNGILYLAGFMLLQYNTRKNGVVLSSVFMKLGLLVPMVLSIFLFGEIPTLLQWTGFLLAVGAILLINYEKGTSLSGAKLPLILMLLAGGLGDAMSKIFEVYGPGEQGDLFLFYTFVGAFLLCLLLIIRNKEGFDKFALLFGVLVGIPNFFSAKFLLMALGELPAVIVYPTYSVATILVVTLAGIGLFGERLKKKQWLALVVILVALIMLNF